MMVDEADEIPSAKQRWISFSDDQLIKLQSLGKFGCKQII